MEKYYYTKVLDAEVLIEAINLRTSLRSLFSGCSVALQKDGTAHDDNVEIVFSQALTSDQQDEVTNVVNAINSSYDLVVRKSIEKSTIYWAMAEGKRIIGQFGSNNIYKGKTDEQIDALLTDNESLMVALFSGSLKSALRKFMVMEPTEDITQDEIDEFTTRLMIILGV